MKGCVVMNKIETIKVFDTINDLKLNSKVVITTNDNEEIEFKLDKVFGEFELTQTKKTRWYMGCWL
jgi:hypothetical protein